MKKLLTYLSLVLCLLLAAIGCGTSTYETEDTAEVVQQVEAEDTADVSEIDSPDSEDIIQEAEVPETDSEEALEELEESAESIDADVEETAEAEVEESAENLIAEDGSYISPQDVALYIHTYGELPDNFITKQEAQELGWVSSEGNLDEVAPGMSIGGNRFGNYEQTLPDGNYKECDVNYTGGYRGDERLVYSEDGSIYYTDDHYATFTQLY